MVYCNIKGFSGIFFTHTKKIMLTYCLHFVAILIKKVLYFLNIYALSMFCIGLS